MCSVKWLFKWLFIYQTIGLVFTLELKTNRAFCFNYRFINSWRDSGFYQYYQIGAQDDVDTAESGSESSGELIQTGLNSPWGILHQIIKETGWTLHYVLWKINRANILLMMADRSNVKSKKETIIKDSGKGLSERYKRKKEL